MRLSHVFVAAHVALVALVIAYALFSGLFYNSPDANLGVGLGGFALIALGVPWSLSFLAFPEGAQGLGLIFAAGSLGTLINLCIHVMLWRKVVGSR